MNDIADGRSKVIERPNPTTDPPTGRPISAIEMDLHNATIRIQQKDEQIERQAKIITRLEKSRKALKERITILAEAIQSLTFLAVTHSHLWNEKCQKAYEVIENHCKKVKD